MKNETFKEGLIRQVAGMANVSNADTNNKQAVINRVITIKNSDQKALKTVQDNLKKSQSVVNQVIGLAKDNNVRNSLKASAAEINKNLKRKIDNLGKDINAIKAETKEALAALSLQKTTDKTELQSSTSNNFKNNLSFLEESDALLANTELNNVQDFLKKSPYLMLQIIAVALINRNGFKTWTLEELNNDPQELRSPDLKTKINKIFNEKMPSFFNKMFLKLFPASNDNPVKYALQYANEFTDLNNPKVDELLKRIVSAYSA